jgi:uncharacterized glyoxalase superfamily protein PhnB
VSHYQNVKTLVKFYASVLEQDAQMSSEDYAEFHTGVGVLAIFSAQAQDRYIPGSAVAAQNRSVILEFKVENVDREYQRLQSVVKNWVKPPTTQPWGTRSIYFKDPDGNLVDFYSRPMLLSSPSTHRRADAGNLPAFAIWKIFVATNTSLPASYL